MIATVDAIPTLSYRRHPPSSGARGVARRYRADKHSKELGYAPQYVSHCYGGHADGMRPMNIDDSLESLL